MLQRLRECLANATVIHHRSDFSAEPPRRHHERLRGLIAALFNPKDKLPGGTAGAIRFERATGEWVGGKIHSVKGFERSVQLERILKEERLSPVDRATAERLLRDLRDAQLGRYPAMNSDLNYGNLSERLVKAVPELESRYEAELEWWNGEWAGPHIVYGDVLIPYLVGLLESRNDRSAAELDRIFQFLEQLAAHEDPRIREVLAYTVLEYLYGNDLLKRARRHMGPLTQKVADDVIEFWRRRRESLWYGGP